MTLTEAVNSAVDAACVIPAKTTNWLSVQNDATSTYALNADNWAYGLSSNHFRCRAVWNELLGRKAGPTLIEEAGRLSTRFCVTAWHWTNSVASWIGKAVRFVRDDGSVVTRTITSGAQIGTTDILLLQFSAAVDYADVGAAKMFAASVAQQISTYPIAGVTVKCDYSDATLRISTQDIRSLLYTGVDDHAEAPRDAKYSAVKGGASGSPLLVAVDDQEVFCGGWTSELRATCPTPVLAGMETSASGLASEAVSFATVDLSAYDIATQIVSFTATPSEPVAYGNSVTLAWSIAGAFATASIDQGIGVVGASGSVTVPLTSRMYTLTVTGSFSPVVNSIVIAIPGEELFVATREFNESVSQLWGNALNWTPNGVPTEDDDVVVPAGKSIDDSSSGFQCKSLRIFGAVSLAGALGFQQGRDAVSGTPSIVIESGGSAAISYGSAGLLVKAGGTGTRLSSWGGTYTKIEFGAEATLFPDGYTPNVVDVYGTAVFGDNATDMGCTILARPTADIRWKGSQGSPKPQEQRALLVVWPGAVFYPYECDFTATTVLLPNAVMPNPLLEPGQHGGDITGPMIAMTGAVARSDFGQILLFSGATADPVPYSSMSGVCFSGASSGGLIELPEILDLPRRTVMGGVAGYF